MRQQQTITQGMALTSVVVGSLALAIWGIKSTPNADDYAVAVSENRYLAQMIASEGDLITHPTNAASVWVAGYNEDVAAEFLKRSAAATLSNKMKVEK